MTEKLNAFSFSFNIQSNSNSIIFNYQAAKPAGRLLVIKTIKVWFAVAANSGQEVQEINLHVKAGIRYRKHGSARKRY